MLFIQNTLLEGDAQNVKDSRMLMPKTRGCRKRCDRVTSNQDMTWKQLYGLETPNECFVLKTRNSETCIYLANNISVNILLDKVSPLFVQEFFLFILFFTSSVNTEYKYITGLRIANDAVASATFFYFAT